MKDKHKLKKEVLEAIRPVLVKDVRRKIATGKIKPPIDMRATANGVWEAVQKNPMTHASVSVLNITLEDIMTVVRDVLKELDIGVTE